MSSERPVLIVDAMNLFVRSWAAYPQMTSNGEQFGGCIGFLKTLSKITSEVQPKAIYVCWEAGGSQRRRALFKEYKLNRRPEKLNRFYQDDIPDTDDNRKRQNIALLRMLKCAPVCQIYVTDCEGDDVIAYLSRGPMRNEQKVIVSSDKDLFQLLDDQTKIYNLHKKTYVTKDDVLETFRVTASNFALAKALCGDPSDNIPGVKGIGFKKVSTLFPFLGTEDSVILEDVLNYCHTHSDESRLYGRILENEDVVKRNWKLVYLDGSMLSASQQTQVDQTIAAFVPRTDKITLIRQLITEGIGDFDVERFFYPFVCIENLQYAGATK